MYLAAVMGVVVFVYVVGCVKMRCVVRWSPPLLRTMMGPVC